MTNRRCSYYVPVRDKEKPEALADTPGFPSASLAVRRTAASSSPYTHRGTLARSLRRVKILQAARPAMAWPQLPRRHP